MTEASEAPPQGAAPTKPRGQTQGPTTVAVQRQMEVAAHKTHSSSAAAVLPLIGLSAHVLLRTHASCSDYLHCRTAGCTRMAP